MAEEQDDASKTEDPTPKRLRDARNKGQVANSKEVSSFLVIVAVAILIGALLAGVMAGISDTLRTFLELSHELKVDVPDHQNNLMDLLLSIAGYLMIPMGMAMAFALAGTLGQVGFLLTTEPMKPKFSKIDPMKGLKRMFSLRSLTEFAKSLFKIALIGAIIIVVMFDELRTLPNFIQMETGDVLEQLKESALIVLSIVIVVVALIAFLDLIYQRHEHHKQLKMTKQEVKDEYKQTEGDPIVKQRLRQIRVERARKRMMAAVPDSSVVITNPTHFAVALKYEQDSMAAPILVAKGADLIAKRIRDLADEHDVPIMENPPLARALYAGVELDQEVPPEHYAAVAEVIGYVMRLKNPGKYARRAPS